MEQSQGVCLMHKIDFFFLTGVLYFYTMSECLSVRQGTRLVFVYSFFTPSQNAYRYAEGQD